MDPNQDPEDDLYAYARPQQQRLPPVFGPITPLSHMQKVLHAYQEGEKIARPSLAQSFIPVVGPAWEAAADLQDGNYGGAAFNGAMAVADALPVGVAVKGLRAASKGVKILKEGSLTADAAVAAYKRRGMVKAGEEVHHTIHLNGARKTPNWRNHYALLKPLPVEQHRRIHGSWDGKPRYDPLRRAWYGTTDWMKAVPTGAAGYTADGIENVLRRNKPSPPSKSRR